MALLTALVILILLFLLEERRRRKQAEEAISELQSRIQDLDHRMTALGHSAREKPPAPMSEAIPTSPTVEAVPPAAPATNAVEPPPAPVPARPTRVPVTASEEKATVAPPAAEESAPAGLEEMLGTRAFVWIGAIALALAGIFLVKYSFDHGWISPSVRILFGITMGLLFLASGHWMRSRSERISQGLSAAGIAVLYASLLAAHHLYGLISGTATFALLVATTIAAVMLSLRQGSFVALLGLIGGFLTPVLIRTEQQSTAAVFTYLAVLELALVYLTHKKAWWRLAALALAASFLWVAVWAIGFRRTEDHVLLSLFTLVSVAAFLVARIKYHDAPRILDWSAAIAGSLVIAVLIGTGNYRGIDWLFLALLSCGFLALSQRDPGYFPLNAFAAILSASMLLVASFSARRPDNFLRILLLFGSLYTIVPYWLMWRVAKQKIHWAALCAGSAAGFFLIAYQSRSHEAGDSTWAALSLFLSAIFAAACVPVWKKREQWDSGLSVLTMLLSGAAFFSSLAVPIALEQHWLTIGWALQIPLLAWIACRLQTPVLFRIATVLLLLISFRLAFGMGVDPNWPSIVLNYGVALAVLLATARMLERFREGKFVRRVHASVAWIAVLFTTVAVHHAFDASGLWPLQPTFAEAGVLISAWFGLALLFMVAGKSREVAFGGGLLLAGFTLFYAVFAQIIALNPLWNHQNVGTAPVLNWLVIGFAVPAGLALILAHRLNARGYTPLATSLRVLATALIFFFVHCEVRQAFHGQYLDAVVVSVFENYCYSAAWILLGCAMLALGVMNNNKGLRYSSLAVMSLAMTKVFLYDSSNLRDLYRVLAFLGLGLSLLGLAYVYQKVVFKRT